MFIFMRHPQAIHNVGYKLSETFQSTVDNDITSIGHFQALEAAKKFKNWLDESGKKVTKVYCSPMIRPMRAAFAVLNEIGFEGTVHLDPIFRERYNGSPCNQGRKKTELVKFLDENEGLLENWDIDISAIKDEIWYDETPETIPELVERAQEIYDNYVEPANENDDEITLVFSHGGIGMALTGQQFVQNCEMIDVQGFQDAESLFFPLFGHAAYEDLRTSPENKAHTHKHS